MGNSKNSNTGVVNALLKSISKMTRLVVLLIIAVVVLFLILIFDNKPLFTIDFESTVVENTETDINDKTSQSDPQKADFFASVKNPLERLDNKNDLEAEYIKYGYRLVKETYKHIGPASDDPSKVYTGNNLACENCHLDAGQKKYSAPYIGVTGRFPQYRGRENKIGTIEERINGCMERSMNGKKLPIDSKEMRSYVAYMNWLSEGVPSGMEIEGKGFTKIDIPNRKVDLKNGQKIYKMRCASCHQPDGQGLKAGDEYTYPPLWGDDSYNHGAGMNRVLTAAQFIKGNMPLGATYENPILSDEEAYDVAGYINSHKRPKKANTQKDYPDLKRKPVSAPYGPWADDFNAEQHKYGPFQEIIKFYKEKYDITKSK
ncbi:c-type cytochrome [Salibacter sp.]|uniref:c-type cytochrome n=1 Tax=Salibacter sp. TaxID=2010995 RepID=UPI0028703C5F|nr:c-type cytochrome [Salibacter sp.]MDR9398299.1 c-type cytochrome [Salibacter sp.]MDR9487691.1 c-type cytochrome [Salibacter sp.]